MKRPMLIVVALCIGCTEAVPYGDPSDAASDDGLVENEPDEGVDEAVEPEFEVCELEGTEELGEADYVIQIRNPECSTSVCLHYNLETFCTHRCTRDRDCRDIARGACELEIVLGDPEIRGRYCVPPSASIDP